MAKPKKQIKTWTRQSGKCTTEGCDEVAVTTGLCAACYQFEFYWTRKKNPAQRRQRQKNLAKYQTRLDAITMASKPRRVK